MNWLAAYRHQLAEETAGRSNRFARILRYFKAFWWICVALALGFLAYGFWLSGTADPRYGGIGMAFIVFPFGALLLVIFGRIPYALAQLFLSVRPKSKE
ncbi:MAG: hypothetical protein ACXWUN_01935 [Allosphingosinicella sp.]